MCNVHGTHGNWQFAIGMPFCTTHVLISMGWGQHSSVHYLVLRGRNTELMIFDPVSIIYSCHPLTPMTQWLLSRQIWFFEWFDLLLQQMPTLCPHLLCCLLPVLPKTSSHVIQMSRGVLCPWLSENRDSFRCSSWPRQHGPLSLPEPDSLILSYSQGCFHTD